MSRHSAALPHRLPRRRSSAITALAAAAAAAALLLAATASNGGSGDPAGGLASLTPAASVTEAVSSTPLVQWVPNGGVHALAQDAKWIYLGGDFSALTSPTTGATFSADGLARVSITSGAPDTTWKPSVTGDVRTMVLDGDTSILYLGGEFTAVDGSARGNLGAVSTADTGTLAKWNPGAADKSVKSLVQVDDSTLLAGGGFLHIGGLKLTHLAKISTAGAIDATFAPAFDGSVYTINHPAGASYVYVGGLFQNINGVERDFLGAISIASGSPTAWNPGNPCPKSTKVCPVFAFVPTASAIYVATGGTTPSGSVISYDPSTAARNWTLSGDGDDQALALIGSELYVGGHFGPSFGGGVRTTLAGIDTTTGHLADFAPSANNLYPGTWALMALPNGSLVAGGDQDHIGGTVDQNYAVFPPVSAGGSSGTPTQRITNGGFENDSLTGWTAYGQKTTLVAVQPKGKAHDGAWVARATNNTDAVATVGLRSSKPQWVTTTKAGSTYAGSVWVSAPVGTKVTLQLHECSVTPAATTGGTSTTTCVGKSAKTVTLTSSGWTNITTSYVAVSSTSSLRFAVFGSLGVHARLRIDTASLTSS